MLVNNTKANFHKFDLKITLLNVYIITGCINHILADCSPNDFKNPVIKLNLESTNISNKIIEKDNKGSIGSVKYNLNITNMIKINSAIKKLLNHLFYTIYSKLFYPINISLVETKKR